jgi:cholesterol oxidase
MWVAQGAGVGGGSLIYANVSIDAKPEMLNSGWPSEINAQVLAPYYARVAAMLKPVTIPDGQETPRTRLLREAAEATGAGHRFEKVPLAVSFDNKESFPETRPDSDEAKRTFTNDFARQQGYCVHCGNCDIGCKAQAKNTLDLNYLAVAEDAEADIRPLSMVSNIVAEEGGFAVVYHDISQGKREERVIRGRQVVLAAGSLGSTEILFRSRDLHKGLPHVSAALGLGWSSNGDFLTPAFYDNRVISPTVGPTITGAIDFLDGSDGGARSFVEDGGFPDVIGNVVRERVRKSGRFSLATKLLKVLAKSFSDGDPLENMMPWFGQAMDGSDGRLYYGRDWLRPWKKRLKLDWDSKRSERGVNGLIGAHKRLSRETGGRAVVPPTWTILRNLVTLHPLGGCNMAASPGAGVVDHLGRVLGHPGLFVADGAIVPRPLGLNPSKTIAALAERIAESILRDPDLSTAMKLPTPQRTDRPPRKAGAT